jgi:DNA-binding PadR family transcriptional regulator
MGIIGGDILKGNTLTLILNLLGEQPMYGFQIAKEVPALHQLKKEDLVESEWRASNQGPRRKYYRLTEKGRREAARLRRRWSAFAGAVDQVLNGGSGD